jgi:hypothetical protein
MACGSTARALLGGIAAVGARARGSGGGRGGPGSAISIRARKSEALTSLSALARTPMALLEHRRR